ncbi:MULTISPECIES: MDR family MFS transporter [Flavobacterium]|uniref:MFS transporter n=1 Tax=Flavobacterium columnare TaxID=996 RepID=A0AA94JNJ0_9FLAO|nr:MULTISPECIES: MFS transporter [Flavobacterium]AMA50351.1 MFS transporter [Flavobacterium covae]AND64107.1 MFS transporter [Flavobacterium covae]MCH4829642.1 MFS transporter [Flavobacterium columnare]MCH4831361.1 MFS transporter [Flavobacterium columnare]MCJ1808501.1 MFS transporter [Flavobacterium covae]
MKKKITYLDNFRGFTKEIWILTLITYINRAGAMVMPFLSNYLHKGFSFTLQEVGWLMSSIGIGSFLGNWIGGKLTDKIGFYTVILSSLLLVGFGFISLMFLYDFIEISIGLFVLTAIADMYKPAVYVAIGCFSNFSNRTRSLTLIRLATNLGMFTGPIIGGVLIANNNYDPLFWIDGISCVTAVILFLFLIDETKIDIYAKRVEQLKETTNTKNSIFRDSNFVIFLLGSFITALLFFQLFTTLPVYNSSKFNFSEMQIGLLLSLNGLLIFLFEMPIIGYLEKTKIKNTKIFQIGSLFMTLGFLFLIFANWIFLLMISILLITLGQILIFSFANTFAFNKATPGQEGRYMALYSMSFSFAQILSSKLSFSIIENYSFNTNWILMALIGVLGIYIYFRLDKNLNQIPPINQTIIS